MVIGCNKPENKILGFWIGKVKNENLPGVWDDNIWSFTYNSMLIKSSSRRSEEISYIWSIQKNQLLLHNLPSHEYSFNDNTTLSSGGFVNVFSFEFIDSETIILKLSKLGSNEVVDEDNCDYILSRY